jgi:quercetin dioxygenase-like cupin family protein
MLARTGGFSRGAEWNLHSAFGPADKPSILLPDSARVYDIERGEARILVRTEQSGGAWWLGYFRNDPGRLTSLHVQHSAEEQFYALEGVISVWVDGGWHDLPPGALAVVPRGTAHAAPEKLSSNSL